MQKESIDISHYPMLLAAQQQQLYNYAVRLHFGGSGSSGTPCLQQFQHRFCQEPKPSYSYIGLIAMAILSTSERQLVLADIYQWILDHYPYFRARGSGWRNSIRHNLSLNDCFVKAGRAANGKGHYWSIHPANLTDFISGDFRRRRAQRRVRKSMGLDSHQDEEEDDDEETLPINGIEHHFEHSLTKFPTEELHPNVNDLSHSSPINSTSVPHNFLQRYFNDIQRIVISHFEQHSSTSQSIHLNKNPIKPNQRKRCFDVDSLLAPEQPHLIKRQKYHLDRHEDVYSPYSKSDGSIDTDTSA